MVEKDKKPTIHPWVNAAKARGLENAFAVLLDVLQPIGPVLAQLLWAMQPAARIFGVRHSISDMADILDAPDGVEILRTQLLGEDYRESGQ